MRTVETVLGSLLVPNIRVDFSDMSVAGVLIRTLVFLVLYREIARLGCRGYLLMGENGYSGFVEVPIRAGAHGKQNSGGSGQPHPDGRATRRRRICQDHFSNRLMSGDSFEHHVGEIGIK